MRKLNRIYGLMLCGLLWLLAGTAAGAEATAAQEKAAQEATLNYMNRPIMVFRTELGETPPEARVARSLRRLEEVERRELRVPPRQVPVVVEGQSGIGLQMGDVLLFTVLPGDRDPESSADVAALATQAQKNLEAALAAYHAQRDPAQLLRGLLWSVLALALLLATGWLLLRLRRWLVATLQQLVLQKLAGSAPWVAYLVQVLERLAQIAIAFLGFGLAYLWLAFTFGQFPLTRPLGEQLGRFLLDLLSHIGQGAIAAVPNLITLAVILLITRTVVQSLNGLFQAVHDGRIVLPGVYRETLGATRRIVVGAVWAIGFTFSYPYIPGSQSDVFKGLSVLFGFMLTLGSAGIVSQLMSGMTLIYARALRKGDLVQIGETVGTVQEVGALSTKVVNLYNEEITIPNAVVVGNQIRNLSRLHEGPGIVVGTKVTIGYDTPWRQVHALLTNAATATAGLKPSPEPRVLQRALNDFYVEYELLVTLADPMQRPWVLSELHAQIQDEFNRHGVQIMSPNFEAQPEGQPVVMVKPEDWFRAPAMHEKSVE